jgi:hypothetical protein
MKRSRIGSWIAIIIGALYFLVPLIGTFEFSLRLRRGEYSFEAYEIVLAPTRGSRPASSIRPYWRWRPTWSGCC